MTELIKGPTVEHQRVRPISALLHVHEAECREDGAPDTHEELAEAEKRPGPCDG